MKFTPRDGRVTIRLQPRGGEVILAVADTGIGISPAFLPYVFDRFSQADGTPTRRHGGLGLGMAIVRYLVELHGGTVHVDSAGENQGATFTLVLPAHAAMSQIEALANVEPEQAATARNLTQFDPSAC